ncbi:MAG TPA: quinone-dependent dihydroorotate dehydrogenase [Thermoanaerobaculia bacterium]|nr:quinone-dependent dihydroorotate dehydrogenase [Thermoanaerobaculia bacterium]
MYPLIRALLFHLDAESAHEFTIAQMRRLQQIPIVLSLIEKICERRAAGGERVLFGRTFRNPIGIAAGFDKNALLMPFLAALGFGFLEVGTVTLHAQPGNPKPRMFRDPERRAIINRLGFNNDGADAVAARLQRYVRRVPLFVNIGKNRDVPLDAAPDAYAACAEKLARFADVVVINVSSPNTPGLRDLQRPEHLERVIAAVGKPKPLLVKIAPDVDDAQLAEVCDVCRRRADGMVCTNTTITPEGGLSGKPLFERSTEVLRKVRERVGAGFPLVGVGGVFTADDARGKLAAGADLVQVYTGFVYEGPFLPSRLARQLRTMNDER